MVNRTNKGLSAKEPKNFIAVALPSKRSNLKGGKSTRVSGEGEGRGGESKVEC